MQRSDACHMYGARVIATNCPRRKSVVGSSVRTLTTFKGVHSGRNVYKPVALGWQVLLRTGIP